jgi:hypothetical protein
VTSLADLDRVTSPECCALALALPLDRDAFIADSDADSKKDYVRSALRGRPAEKVWAEDGLPLAELCRDLLAVAEDLGVTTVAMACQADLRSLFRNREVVTIVAHWRGAALVGADFTQEPKALIEAIRSGEDQLCRDLAGRLPFARTDAALSLPVRRQRAELAELLNETVIRSDRPIPGALESSGNVPVVIDELSLRSRQRARLDAAFPTMLHPGNRLELRDGLHGPSEIAACVPEEWSGTVDFAICQSAYLAHEVKNGRIQRQVITNLHEVVPGVRLRIQKELYRRLARGGNYANELIELFIEISAARPPVEKLGIWHRVRQHLRMGDEY